MSETKDEQAKAAQPAPSSPETAPKPDAPPAEPAASKATETVAEATAAETAEQLRRRVRRSAKIDAPEAVAPPVEEQVAEPSASDAPPAKKRRRRRRRTKPARSEETTGESREATAAPPSDADGESPLPTRARRARRRVKPPSDPPPERPAKRRRDSAPARGPQAERATPAAERPAGRPPRAPRAKEGGRGTERRPSADGRAKPAAKPPQKPGKGGDMITLLLHPPPKAAPTRRKKAGRPLTAKEALKAKAAKRKSGGRAKGAAEPAEAAPQEVELTEEWLNADGSSACDCAIAAGDGALQLVQAWQQQPNAEAVAAVAYSSAEAIPGAVRKAARRAVSVLKSRGVAVPDRAPEPVGPARTGAAADRESEPVVATFVPPDTNGMTFFSISQRLAGGRYRVADVVIRDELGIMHASSGKLAGKQIRRWRQRVESRLGTAPVAVPVEWARFRIARARKQNEVSGQVLPLGLDSCASMFEPVPDAEPTHPLAGLGEDLKEAEVAAATTDSEQLHNEPEFRSWLPERSALDGMLRSVGTRVGAEGADDRELVDKVLAEEMESATDRHFSPEQREAVAARMRDAAISIRQRADDDVARRVLCVAQAIRQAGLITSPPREVPFLIGFFRKALAMLAQQGDGRLQVPIAGAPPQAEQAGQDATAQPETK